MGMINSHQHRLGALAKHLPCETPGMRHAHKGLNDTADSDGEEVTLCCRCKLPVGDVAYAGDGRGSPMHGECMAQRMLLSLKEEEQYRKKRDAGVKIARRAQYDL